MKNNQTFTLRTLTPALSRVLCMFCASFLMVGCSYLAEFSRVGGSNGGDVVYDSSASGQDVPLAPLYESQVPDIAETVSRNTNGSVEIFSLDDPAPPVVAPASDAFEVRPAQVVPVSPLSSVSRPSQKTVAIFSADPSVEVFPFDDLTPLPVAGFETAGLVRQPVREEEYVSVATQSGNTVTVYFGHDSATLNAAALRQIEGVSKGFNNVAGRGLTVEGHASVKANYNSVAQRRLVNLRISMDRAFAVASALIKRGVPAEAIRVMAWGDAIPPRTLNGKSREQAARRVEISS